MLTAVSVGLACGFHGGGFVALQPLLDGQHWQKEKLRDDTLPRDPHHGLH